MLNAIYSAPMLFVCVFSTALFIENLPDITKSTETMYVIPAMSLHFLQYWAIAVKKRAYIQLMEELQSIVNMSRFNSVCLNIWVNVLGKRQAYPRRIKTLTKWPNTQTSYEVSYYRRVHSVLHCHLLWLQLNIVWVLTPPRFGIWFIQFREFIFFSVIVVQIQLN